MNSERILTSTFNWLPALVSSTYDMFLASVPILTAHASQVPAAQDMTGLSGDSNWFPHIQLLLNSWLSSTWPPASKTSFNLSTFLLKNCQCLPATYRIGSLTSCLCGLALFSSKVLSSLGLVTTSFFQIYHTCTSMPLLILFLLSDVAFPFSQPSELLFVLQPTDCRETLTFLPR